MNCHSPEAAAHDSAVGFQVLSTWPSHATFSGTPSSLKIRRAIRMNIPERYSPTSIVVASAAAIVVDELLDHRVDLERKPERFIGDGVLNVLILLLSDRIVVDLLFVRRQFEL